MPLRPFKEDPIIPDELTEILIDAGLAQPKKDNSREQTRGVFDRHKASLEDAAFTIGAVMANGDTDAGRLKAAELALKVQGILDDKLDKVPTTVTINIIGKENKTLLNLVMPQQV